MVRQSLLLLNSASASPIRRSDLPAAPRAVSRSSASAAYPAHFPRSDSNEAPEGVGSVCVTGHFLDE
jgi:hypothetical protein